MRVATTSKEAPAVSITSEEDFISYKKGFFRVHGVNFTSDKSIADLFYMAARSEHLIFQKCKFENSFSD